MKMFRDSKDYIRTTWTKKYFKIFDIIVIIKCLKWKWKDGNTIHGVQTPKTGIQEM